MFGDLKRSEEMSTHKPAIFSNISIPGLVTKRDGLVLMSETADLVQRFCRRAVGRVSLADARQLTFGKDLWAISSLTGE